VICSLSWHEMLMMQTAAAAIGCGPSKRAGSGRTTDPWVFHSDCDLPLRLPCLSDRTRRDTRQAGKESGWLTSSKLLYSVTYWYCTIVVQDRAGGVGEVGEFSEVAIILVPCLGPGLALHAKGKARRLSGSMRLSLRRPFEQGQRTQPPCHPANAY
jgi:uncharacterized membrane protein YhdT